MITEDLELHTNMEKIIQDNGSQIRLVGRCESTMGITLCNMVQVEQGRKESIGGASYC